jgi:hypothetical protein
VEDSAATATLRITVPFCRDHFDRWADAGTVGKDVESIAPDRFILYPKVESERR